MTVIDETTGDPTPAVFGARTGVGVDTSVTVLPSDRTRCGVGVRAPVWQRVSGVQLVETFAATTPDEIAALASR